MCHAGVFPHVSDVCSLLEEERVFDPQPENRDHLLRHYKEWRRAVKRFGSWHQQ